MILASLAVKDLRIPATRLVRLFQWAILTQLNPLRVKSSAGWRHLIFNDLEALQVESSGHFDHLIFRNRLMNFRSRIREEIEFHLADLTTLFSGN